MLTVEMAVDQPVLASAHENGRFPLRKLYKHARWWWWLPEAAVGGCAESTGKVVEVGQ